MVNITEWLLVVREGWWDLRVELGDRLAKSKRREIAELQIEVRQLRAKSVYLMAEVAALKIGKDVDTVFRELPPD